MKNLLAMLFMSLCIVSAAHSEDMVTISGGTGVNQVGTSAQAAETHGALLAQLSKRDRSKFSKSSAGDSSNMRSTRCGVCPGTSIVVSCNCDCKNWRSAC